MQFNPTPLQGVLEVVPPRYQDNRGWFSESYHRDKFAEAGITETFLQMNKSFSHKQVLRGLHIQRDPYGQAKLAAVQTGRVWDVVVDVRPDSPSFRQWYALELSADTGNMLYVPEGILHGFLALEDTVFTYLCSNVYNKDSEMGVIWNDQDLAIDWPTRKPIVSGKDKELLSLNEFLAAW